jgi:hypothetical protein
MVGCHDARVALCGRQSPAQRAGRNRRPKPLWTSAAAVRPTAKHGLVDRQRSLRALWGTPRPGESACSKVVPTGEGSSETGNPVTEAGKAP